MLVPAELPGRQAGEFWAVFERLDSGEVGHHVYRGLMERRLNEPADELQARAEDLLARRD